MIQKNKVLTEEQKYLKDNDTEKQSTYRRTKILKRQ